MKYWFYACNYSFLSEGRNRGVEFLCHSIFICYYHHLLIANKSPLAAANRSWMPNSLMEKVFFSVGSTFSDRLPVPSNLYYKHKHTDRFTSNINGTVSTYFHSVIEFFTLFHSELCFFWYTTCETGRPWRVSHRIGPHGRSFGLCRGVANKCKCPSHLVQL